jgi:DNA-binding SARP family transcriptional activator
VGDERVAVAADLQRARFGAALPPISESAVARPRVSHYLLERLERHGLVQVLAAAGSGKTTAVRQAVEAQHRPVTWLGLEEWHRPPGRLLDAIVDALGGMAPGLHGELVRTRADGLETVQLAAIAGGFLRRQEAVLVVDDCHVLDGAPGAVSVLSALIRRAVPGLQVVLVGRFAPRLLNVGIESLVPEATIDETVLSTTLEEAREILQAHGFRGDADEVFRATGGWIAGLLFESWGERDELRGDDPLRGYLGREIRARLTAEAWDLLVVASAFDEIGVDRARAIGSHDPGSWLYSLKQAGLPAGWAPHESGFRLHPRVRELLRDELSTGPEERRIRGLRTAARTHEADGDAERALELYLELGETDAVRRLVPAVVGRVVERHDLRLADRYLTAYDVTPEPAAVVLARLCLASLRASYPEGLAVVDRLTGAGRADEVVAAEPAVGALACWHLAGSARVADAEEMLELIPAGRAADVARLLLSVVRDDPEAPIPPFRGDVLDAVLARALYHRGRLRELREGRTGWSESTGVHALDTLFERGDTPTPPLVRTLARFAHAVAIRDIQSARASVLELAPYVWYHDLADLEFAVRLERDPVRSREVIDRLRAHTSATVPFYREVVAAWEGAALLLAEEHGAARKTLRAAVTSMRRGDRRLALVSALVYLAEAEWRCGEEDASDHATGEAYEVAADQGTLRELRLALADFPGVLSRRLDVEGVEGPWHSLGRSLSRHPGGVERLAVQPVAAHLREFGEPGLLLGGHVVGGPRRRKSTELLSYLLHATGGSASRADILRGLWNGQDNDSTRAYLRQALRELRIALPVGISVTATRDMLALEGDIGSESLEFDSLVAQAATATAADSLGYVLDALEFAERGEFLPGSDDVWWVEDRRRQIASALTDVRLDAANIYLEADQHLRSIALVDDVLDSDPLRERAWRLRMQALALLGDFDGVTAAYAGCARALGEIGLEPSRSTRELAQSLRR